MPKRPSRDRGGEAPNPPRGISEDPLWYKDAVIYELHVKAFFDANGDGYGDFAGLTQKLDYLEELGVNTLWLLPFYPSPLKDDGYDIADYRGIHPDYGTMTQFKAFVREAHRRGLRVITELVVNHTSDQHPWFQAARRAAPGSAKRDFYVWSDTADRYAGTRIIFTDTEASNWAWDDVAKAYYWHRFFSHQPDLNFENPRVLEAVLSVMRYWMDMGVDGMRLDAIPYLKEREGTNNENLPETHEVIRAIRAGVDARYSDRMLLAEANQWPEDVREYFGDGDECHMAYHFPLMPRLFMAIAQEDRHPVTEILRQTPDIPPTCQWAIFLRNHDELTLEMVTDRERDYMYRMYANDPRMRVNVGIRRRLAPLMENDRRRIELSTFLLMTMPGSPILYYGDEIGMGDNVFLGDRNGVRTPMQWSPDRNAGFSRADPQRLYLPPVMDPEYGYAAVNVEAQARSPSSLLNWTRRIIRVRNEHRAFGRGTLEFLEPGNRKILAYLREHEGDVILCVANLSRHPQAVTLDLSQHVGRVPLELTGRESFPPITPAPYALSLSSYGYLAFSLTAEAPVPEWFDPRHQARDLEVLVLLDGIGTLLGASGGSTLRRDMAARTRAQFVSAVLRPYLEGCRWFAAKGRDVSRVELVSMGEWSSGAGPWTISFVDVHVDGDERERYFVPLAVGWEGEGRDPTSEVGSFAMARIRDKNRMGVLHGAFGDPEFARALARRMGQGGEDVLGTARLRFVHTSAYASHADGLDGDIRAPAMDQSNTSILFGDRLYLKGYRRPQPGAHPEVEIGRFLTDVSPFPNVAPLLGCVELVEADGSSSVLAILQGQVENQGNAWTYTRDYVDRIAQRLPMGDGDGAVVAPADDPHAEYTTRIEILGRRVGELHQALAATTGDDAFDPVPLDAVAAGERVTRIARDLGARLDVLERRLDELPEGAREPAAELVAARPRLVAWLEGLDVAQLTGQASRVHGDLHLGQVLLEENDFVIVDFEGEPSRPLEERRAKASPMRDVAGMVRSFDYAAGAVRLESGFGVDRLGRLEAEVSAWLDAAERAFLDGYREATRDCPTVTGDEPTFQAQLELYLVEKAVYELGYEMENRPRWTEIPVRGLLGVLTRLEDRG